MVFALDLPPKLILPEKPTIIRPGLDTASFFPMPFLAKGASVGPIPTWIASSLPTGTFSSTMNSRVSNFSTDLVGYTGVADDICVVEFYDNTGTAGGGSGHAVSGYTKLLASATTSKAIWWKRLVGGETSLTMTWGGSSQAMCHYTIIRGCRNTGSPFNASAVYDEASSVNNTLLTFSGLTTTVNNCLILGMALHSSQNTDNMHTTITNASLANNTERTDKRFNGSPNAEAYTFTGEMATAGAVSTTTVAHSSLTGQVAAFTLAMGPTGW